MILLVEEDERTVSGPKALKEQKKKTATIVVFKLKEE
jgi:hypothetical protein